MKYFVKLLTKYNNVFIEAVAVKNVDNCVVVDTTGVHLLPKNTVDSFDWTPVTKEVYQEFRSMIKEHVSPKVKTSYDVIVDKKIICSGFSTKNPNQLAEFFMEMKGQDIRILDQKQNCVALLNGDLTKQCSYLIKTIK